MLCGCLTSTPSIAALHITEFMARNGGSVVDQDGDSSDWIEIFNSGPNAVALGGMHLTDDSKALTKWQFPAIVLDPDRFLLIFASEKDRRVRGSELHTNFKLSSGGEYLALVDSDGSTIIAEMGGATNPLPEQFEDISYGIQQTSGSRNSVLVRSRAECRVMVPADGSLGDSWTASDFDDSSWGTAETGVGYDNSTNFLSQFGVGGFLADALFDRNTSVYIRIPFQVVDPTLVAELTLKMKYDAGFVAYLNGRRVAGQQRAGGDRLEFGRHGESASRKRASL